MSGARGTRLQPEFPAPAGRDLELEGLRGLCALAVFYAHIFIPGPALDPAWQPSARFWYFNFGTTAVLMFFVLSGYVIGLVTTQPPTAAHLRTYLVHRAARLLPLNTAAVLLSAALLPVVSGRALAGNLLLLQNSEPYPILGAFPFLPNNLNLWSLNYEAVYYLAFILLWRFAPRATVVFGLLALAVAVHSLGGPVSALLARYACGGFYWLAGLVVAWHAAPVPAAQRRTNWPAAFLALGALWQLGPLRALLYDGHLHGWLWTSVLSPHRLDLLPGCVWVLLAVTGRAPSVRRALTWACLTWLTAGLHAQAALREWREIHTIAAGEVALAWLFARGKFSLAALRRCAPLGAISFGLYIVAGPLHMGQHALLPGFSGSWLTFTGRALALTALTVGVAWLLERRCGAPVGRWLRRKFAGPLVEKM